MDILPIYVLCTCVMGALAFRSGAGLDCVGMMPSHPGSAQTGPEVVLLSLSQSTYSPGQQISVTLSGAVFKGFLIQARTNVSTATSYGTFDTPDGTHNPCGSMAAVSHANSDPKSTISINWTAPPASVGNITFVYTVVVDYRTYWAKIEGHTISSSDSSVTSGPSLSSSTSPTDRPTALTTSQSTQHPTISSSNTVSIDRDAACEVSKSCFPPPDECSKNCNYLVTWSLVGTDDVEFVLQRKTTENQHYIAIGFSDDAKMTNDSVVYCVINNMAVEVIVSYNPGVYNDRLSDMHFGLSDYSGKFVNGILRCTFRRKLNAQLAAGASSGTSGRRRRAISDDTTFFDLNTEWFLFVAHGPSSSGYPLVHIETPSISPRKINFLEQLNHTSTGINVSEGVITKDGGCGLSVGCFSNCESDGCKFVLTWKDEEDHVTLSLKCKATTNSYCAIGLSKDDKMGDDNVIECLTSLTGTVTVRQSFNDGKQNLQLDDSSIGINVTFTTHTDGIMTCAFTRKKTYALAISTSTNRTKRAVTSAATYFDMNVDYTLMFATGSAIGGSLQKHETLPLVSSQKADFQSVEDISAGEVNRTLIRLHGNIQATIYCRVYGLYKVVESSKVVGMEIACFCLFEPSLMPGFLTIEVVFDEQDGIFMKNAVETGMFMTISWLLLATTGIFLARYYKSAWPGEHQDCCGLKRWFVVHRACMVLVFVMTSLSFVIIFVHVEGYSEIAGNNFEKSHPILGIIVMALTIINPTMALFRPNPGSSKRIYFNVGHTLVGYSALICGVVNLFSGTILTAASIKPEVRYVLWTFVGLVVFALIVSQTYDCLEMGSSGLRSSYELDQFSEPGKAALKKEPSQTFKVGLLYVTVLGLIVLTITVVVYIWLD